jgi:hypothetical protein
MLVHLYRLVGHIDEFSPHIYPTWRYKLIGVYPYHRFGHIGGCQSTYIADSVYSLTAIANHLLSHSKCDRPTITTASQGDHAVKAMRSLHLSV